MDSENTTVNNKSSADSQNATSASSSAPASETEQDTRSQPAYYPETIASVLSSPVTGKKSPSGKEHLVNIPMSLITYRSDFYVGYGNFDDEIEAYSKLPKVNSGYSNLDSHQRLYPGLYILGALSSLGKTTFLHQMADQIAIAGTPVLYFSLEQNPLEMYSKSMSRRIFLHSLDDDTYRTFSAIQIRDGQAKGTRELIEQEGGYYSQVKGRITIVHGRDITVEKINDYVFTYCSEYDVIPVVIVDYLQHIDPSPEYPGSKRLLDTRSQIDHAMKTLKHMQEDLNLVVLVISSLNRMNYLTPIDFESFKESGNIEYGADAVWGLQLQVIHSDVFNKKDNVSKKRELVNLAKSAIPRKIEFVCLKNRSGQPVYTEMFDYYPQFDTFIPETDDGRIKKARNRVSSNASPVSGNGSGVSKNNPASSTSKSSNKLSESPDEFAKWMKISERASIKYNKLTPEQQKRNYTIGSDVIAISDICTVNRADFGPDTTEDVSAEEQRLIANPEYCAAVKKFYRDLGVTCWNPDPQMYGRTRYYKVNKDGTRGDYVDAVDDPEFRKDMHHYLDLFDKAMDKLSPTLEVDEDRKAVEKPKFVNQSAADELAAIEEKFRRLTPEQLNAIYHIEGEYITLSDEKPDIDITGMSEPVIERISASEDRITPDPAYAEAVAQHYKKLGVTLWAPLKYEYPCTVYYEVDSAGRRKGKKRTEFDDPYSARLNTYYRLRREAIKKIRI